MAKIWAFLLKVVSLNPGKDEMVIGPKLPGAAQSTEGLGPPAPAFLSMARAGGFWAGPSAQGRAGRRAAMASLPGPTCQ